MYYDIQNEQNKSNFLTKLINHNKIWYYWIDLQQYIKRLQDRYASYNGYEYYIESFGCQGKSANIIDLLKLQEKTSCFDHDILEMCYQKSNRCHWK